MNLRGLSGLRRLAWRCSALPLVVLLLAGCPSNEPELATPISETESEAAPLAGELLSSVHMGDPQAVPQLVEGFYGLEQGVWRWTARKFVVALRPPSGGAGQETQLEFKFTVPDAIISRVGGVTLTARVDGADLGSESYSQAGEYIYTKSVPAGVLAGGQTVKVEFELDKALPPGEADKRELGLVAISVALK